MKYRNAKAISCGYSRFMVIEWIYPDGARVFATYRYGKSALQIRHYPTDTETFDDYFTAMFPDHVTA